MTFAATVVASWKVELTYAPTRSEARCEQVCVTVPNAPRFRHFEVGSGIFLFYAQTASEYLYVVKMALFWSKSGAFTQPLYCTNAKRPTANSI